MRMEQRMPAESSPTVNFVIGCYAFGSHSLCLCHIHNFRVSHKHRVPLPLNTSGCVSQEYSTHFHDNSSILTSVNLTSIPYFSLICHPYTSSINWPYNVLHSIPFPSSPGSDPVSGVAPGYYIPLVPFSLKQCPCLFVFYCSGFLKNAISIVKCSSRGSVWVSSCLVWVVPFQLGESNVRTCPSRDTMWKPMGPPALCRDGKLCHLLMCW